MMFEEVLKAITSELKTFASTSSVVGEPINIDGKTIIPVIKLKLGFGGGSGVPDAVRRDGRVPAGGLCTGRVGDPIPVEGLGRRGADRGVGRRGPACPSRSMSATNGSSVRLGRLVRS